MRLNLQKLLKEKNVDNEILVKNFLDTQNKEKNNIIINIYDFM